MAKKSGDGTMIRRIVCYLVLAFLLPACQTHAQTSPLQMHADYTLGLAPYRGSVDPETYLSFLPAPTPGYVRVPLFASIQSDGPEPLVTCHAILRRAEYSSTWRTDPTTMILWSIKLTPDVMVVGEFFLPVPLIPIPEGYEIIASWSYATASQNLRTRAVSVEVPANTFDWSRAWSTLSQPQQTAR